MVPEQCCCPFWPGYLLEDPMRSNWLAVFGPATAPANVPFAFSLRAGRHGYCLDQIFRGRTGFPIQSWI